jgi:hypothetical protein
MQTIEGQTAEGITIAMDNKFFLNCRFTRCKLIFSGEQCEWLETAFIDCYVQMIGPALIAVNLLHSFGFAKDFGGTSTTPSSSSIQ